MTSEEEQKILERFGQLVEEIEKETDEVLGVVVSLPIPRSNREIPFEWNGERFVRSSPNSPGLAWSRKIQKEPLLRD